MRRVPAVVIALLTATMLAAEAAEAALPAGFARSTVGGPLSLATTLALAPDGRIFVGQLTGEIRLIEGGVLQAAPLLALAVANQGERGLVGLTLDPAFATNGFLYVYYTTLEPRNRVSRFTVVGNTASPASEVLIWQNPATAGEFHHGGCIRFGPDGNLYISTGDQFFSANAQSLFTEHGKILRVTPSGAIPAGNPFVGVPGARPAIWAYGLRNPFRIQFDSLTGALWIGDVGGNGPDAFEEVNLGQAGANYGWPNQEGPACYAPPCSPYTFPIYFYAHDVPGSQGQASITLGPVYRGSMFPAAYVGNLFVADYSNRWMRRVQLGPGPSVIADPYFDTAPDTGSVTDVELGPDGALYYVTIGFDAVGDPDPLAPSAVYRIAYTAGGNQAPVAVAGATPASGVEPLLVQFSSAGSEDPDDGPLPLSFAWLFGDGGSSTLPGPDYTYTQPGVYTAQLSVSDGVASANASVPVRVGRPPLLQMLTPAVTPYRAGDEIGFSATATDPEDGTLAPAAFSWTVLLRHLQHVHPFLGPLPGIASGSFTIPDSGHSPADTSYEISVTATDSDGLDVSVVRSIQPLISNLVFDTAPSGIPFFLDGAPFNTPLAYPSNPGFRHQVEAQQSYTLAGLTWEFSAWSDAGARSHEYLAPEGGGSLVASYVLAPDADGDGVSGALDGCPTVADASQQDGDMDGVGDVCDNCPATANPRPAAPVPAWMTLTGGQRDGNVNGRGDRCDWNYDAIGVLPTATDFNHLKASVAKLTNAANCGTSGSMRCQRFDTDESGAVITNADFNSGKANIAVLPPPTCGACGNFYLLPCQGPGCP